MAEAWLSPSEAADMLFLDPEGPMENFSFGILRRSLRGRANDPLAFARAKLQPVRPAGDPARLPWPVTAAASCVLLPPGAPDDHADPDRLFTSYVSDLLAREKAMLVLLTLRLPEVRLRHEMFEEALAFALDRLVRARRLSTLVTLHLPGAAGSSNVPHVHLLSVVREHHGWGYGPYVRSVIDRTAQPMLFREWQAHRAAWRTLP